MIGFTHGLDIYLHGRHHVLSTCGACLALTRASILADLILDSGGCICLVHDIRNDQGRIND